MGTMLIGSVKLGIIPGRFGIPGFTQRAMVLLGGSDFSCPRAFLGADSCSEAPMNGFRCGHRCGKYIAVVGDDAALAHALSSGHKEGGHDRHPRTLSTVTPMKATGCSR